VEGTRINIMKLIGLEKWQISSNICYFLIRFLGTPFFHSMVARAQATTSDISMLIDSETILFPEILNTLVHIQKQSKDWFVFSFTPNILNFEYQLAGSGHNWFRQDGRMIKAKKVL
jgi:beta-arabinofuranosyltransferase